MDTLTAVLNGYLADASRWYAAALAYLIGMETRQQIVLGAGIWAASLVIVLLDRRRRRFLALLFKWLGRAVPGFLALAALGYLVWQDFDPLMGLSDRLLAEAWRRSNIPSITFLWPWLLAIITKIANLGLIVGLLLGGIAGVIARFIPLLAGAGLTLSLPALALWSLMSLLGWMVMLPCRGVWIGLRELFYFCNQPPALKPMKQVMRAKDAAPEAIAAATQALRQEYQTMREALPQPTKKPTMVIQAYTHHYQRWVSKARLRAYTGYIQAVGAAADTLHDHVEHLKRRPPPGERKDTRDDR